MNTSQSTHPIPTETPFRASLNLTRRKAALATMRLPVAPAGVCLVADENVAEHFEAPTDNPIELIAQ